MVHQIRVSPADRNAFGFLWWPTGELNQEAVDHRMEDHSFGATSSPSCSGFSLRKTAGDNKGVFKEKAVKTKEKLLRRRLSQISKVCWLCHPGRNAAIHLSPKWRRIDYSLVCTLISPLCLVYNYKKTKEFWTEVWQRGLINMQAKE